MRSIFIKSRSHDGILYEVALDEHGLAIGCSCEAAAFHRKCWHLRAAELKERWIEAANFLARRHDKEAVIEKFAIIEASEGTLKAIEAIIGIAEREAKQLRLRAAQARKEAASLRVYEATPLPRAGDPCTRCKGEGHLDKFAHVKDGVCFACGGSGKVPGPRATTGLQ